MHRPSTLLLAALLVLPTALAAKPRHGRLDSILNGLVEQLDQRKQPAETIARKAAFSRRDAVAVTIRTQGELEPLLALLEERGATVANQAPGVVEAYVPLSALAALGEHPDVLGVRSILPTQPLGIVSEGAVVHGAIEWQAAGILGTGVKVGVIDVGFEGYSLLAGVEVPTPKAVRCYSGVGSFSSNLAACETGGVHGTGVTEAIVDIAPGVEIYLANPASGLDLLQTVHWMASQGVRVINHSAQFFYEGPGDGTSSQPDSRLAAVDAAVQAGILWVNAAGNEAEKHWRGAFKDSDGDNFLEFTGNVENNAITLPAGARLLVESRWQDSWGAASRDLDLFLLNGAGQVVAKAEEQQDGQPGRIPMEVLAYEVPADGTYHLAVRRFGGSVPGWVQVHLFPAGLGPLAQRTASYSIANPAESRNPGMLAVGAAAWSTPGQIEPFSSQGPTSDGRIKPDLVGADRGNSVAYGPDGFQGTSQAAPHVAGLAALVRQAVPAASPAEVAAFLKATAIPTGSPVPNSTWGAGFAFLPPLTEPGVCTPGATAMCLGGDRFQVEATWRTSQGATGAGQAVRLTGDSGYFWFFNPANIEMVIKVVNGCGSNNRHWVFAGGLTDVRVDIRVTDTATGAVRTYTNPLGVAFAPIQDTSAFATCP